MTGNSGVVVDMLVVVERYAMIDGGHHKQWVIDQMVRTILGPEQYARWREAYDVASERDGYAQWDEGIAP
jgi:hypothetical protein